MGEMLRRPFGIILLAGAFLVAGLAGIAGFGVAWPRTSNTSPLAALVRPHVELHVRRHRHPHVAPLSPRSSRLPCGDRIIGVPGVVYCPRGTALSPFVRGYRSCRFPRLPVSPEGTCARRLTTSSNISSQHASSAADTLGAMSNSGMRYTVLLSAASSGVNAGPSSVTPFAQSMYGCFRVIVSADL